MAAHRTSAALAGCLALCFAPGIAVAQRAPAIPSPASILGFEPGADRHLPSWKQITDYFTALDKASPRVTTRVLGKTTLGRPFLAVFISDSSTLANLEHFRQVQRKLMDPRLQARGRATEADRGGQERHPRDVGNSLERVRRLHHADRARRSARARRGPGSESDSREHDHHARAVAESGWRRHRRRLLPATLGTPQEGRDPPDLYHKYVGHDDNRDWYSFTQVETRYTVDSLYTPWDPQIVNDIHQQGGNAGRIFIPPYMDPVEPNIDPILTAATNGLGMSIVWRMTNQGFTGIASNASYDQWSPARQYSLVSPRRASLTETASARLATPVDVSFDQLGTGRGYDARIVSWNYPSLWTGGHWTYGDIVKYQTAASWALFLDAALNRRAWVEGYAAQADRAMAAEPAWGNDKWPSAIVFSKTQPDTQALKRMIWTLQHGQVEIRETTAPVTTEGKTYPAGSYVIFTRQPFGAYAKALLERQKYPDLFDYPGGPPKRPYDVTAHTVPLLFGVDVAHVMGEAPAAGPVLKEIPEPTYTSPLTGKSTKRIALFRQSGNESMDHGWTHWLFDEYKIPYTIITEKDLGTPLNDRFDAIVFSEGTVGGGRGGGGGGGGGRGRGGAPGGGGAADVFAALDAFVNNGGNVLAFNTASTAMIEGLKLPVTNVLAGVRNTDFYAPGSILGVDIKRDNPIARGFTATIPAVWFENGPAFDVTDPSVATVVASYPASGNPLLSGWLLGGTKLNGKAALVDVKHGKGHVVLYGFRPQYRGQAVSTYPLIWGAIAE